MFDVLIRVIGAKITQKTKTTLIKIGVVSKNI